MHPDKPHKIILIMKTLKYFVMAFIAISLASCGSKDSDKAKADETTPVTVEDNEDADEAEGESTYSSVSSESSYSSSDDMDSETDLTDDDNDKSSSSASSKNWNDMLNSYEKFVDKYIACLKKATNGDMSAYAEVATLMQEAQDFGDKIEKARDDMSAADWGRYMKITSKLSTAAMQMN